MSSIYIPDPEELGRRRFPDDKGFRLDLYNRAMSKLATVLDLLPSNYTKEQSTNLAILYQVLAREFSRIHYSNDAINNDKVYTSTRIEYLQQILGERLFLQERIAPAGYNDATFRDYLISLKNAYLKGSIKSNIEETASKFTGLDINIKELYLEARKPGSSYGVSDTNKMIVEVLIDDLIKTGRNFTELSNDLDFFINLIRPAHVLYDTHFIWTEQFDTNKVHDLIYGDTGGGCIPVYLYGPLDEFVILAFQVNVQLSPIGATGRIDSIHHDDLIFFLADETRVITEPGVDGTKIFDASGKRITINELRIGQYVKISYVRIPGTFQFWWRSPYLGTNPYALFYRSTYRLPVFQEFVKKQMDSQGRFPLQMKSTETTICDRWVQDLLVPHYEDLRKFCTGQSESEKNYSSTLNERMGFPRFSYPWDRSDIHDMSLFGDNFEFTMPYKPITDGSGAPAIPSDIVFRIDGTTLSNAISAADASTGIINLTSSYTYWDSSAGHYPIPGNSFEFLYHYSSDGTVLDATSAFVYGISYWQMPTAPLVSETGSLAESSDVTITVDGTAVVGAVSVVDGLLGHVTLNSATSFWVGSELGRIPRVGDVFDFQFYRGNNLVYTMLYDDLGRMYDSYKGYNSPYTMVYDGELGTDIENGAGSFETPAEIGYRYRAYLLHHTSVLNSPDTLLLNNFQKPAKRASLINQQDSLNHMNLFFSGEFLYDTSSSVVLNDKYLDNGLDPVLKLYEGTPPFQKTWSHHPGLVYQRKLQDIRQHHNPLMYSDLLLKEFLEGDSVNLSSICDSESPVFQIRFTETLDQLKECDPWILFDTVETDDVRISLPGMMEAVHNVRVAGKLLRSNFILRERSDIGTMYNVYTVLTPADVAQTTFNLPASVKKSTTEYGYVDFSVLPIMKNLTTYADPSDITVKVNGVPVPGAVLTIDPVTGVVVLSAAPPFSATVEFTYKVLNTQWVEVLDEERTRVYDYEYVYPSACPDPIKMQSTIVIQEYINFLDDNSTGIKLVFFNKDTYAIEEHIFSGPVFETYSAAEDEISTPETFPNALVRIQEPGRWSNPLNYAVDYSFLNDPLVKFRKKTYRELLPDRTFRTIKQVEVSAL